MYLRHQEKKMAETTKTFCFGIFNGVLVFKYQTHSCRYWEFILKSWKFSRSLIVSFSVFRKMFRKKYEIFESNFCNSRKIYIITIERLHNHYRKTKECMTQVSTKMKRKHEVAIYENKRARGRHKGKGYTIATLCLWNNIRLKVNEKTKCK